MNTGSDFADILQRQCFSIDLLLSLLNSLSGSISLLRLCLTCIMWSLPLSIYLESKAIDLKEYSIIAGKYCWVIQVDFLVSVPFFSYTEALPIYLRLMKYVCM